MSLKSNLRSFRYSDEVATILEAQEGKSLNDKFESLVLFCYYKVEQRKKDLEYVNQKISQTREKLYKLEKATEELQMLERDLKSAKYYFEIVERRAKAIAEAAEKDELPKPEPCRLNKL